MPAQAAIVINDGQATPVAHTFNPNGALRSPDKKVQAEWVDRSPVNSAGYLEIEESHAPYNSNGMEKMRWSIDVPTLESVVGGGGTGYQAPPKRAYAGVIVIEVMVHERATPAERANYAAYLKNFAASAYVKSKVETGERTW